MLAEDIVEIVVASTALIGVFILSYTFWRRFRQNKQAVIPREPGGDAPQQNLCNPTRDWPILLTMLPARI